MNKTIYITLLLLFFCFLSCQNDAKWYPDADVTIASHYEYSEPITLTKQILITCVIHNTSDTTITSGAITLQVKTDKKEYLQTISLSNVRIIPDGKIAVNTTVVYIDNTEQLITDGVTVYSSFFD